MKNIFILLLIMTGYKGVAQVASRIINTQATPHGKALNIMYVDTSLGLVNNKIWNCTLDSILLNQFTIKGLPDSLLNKVNQVQLASFILKSDSSIYYPFTSNPKHYLIGNDTSSLSNRINTKLSSIDTGNINNFFTKVRAAQSNIDTSSLSSRVNQRVKYTDTAFMLSGYGAAIGLRVRYSDTANMLSGYRSAIDLRLKISDTISLSNRINTKQATITLGTTSQYLRGDLSLATFPTSNLNVFDKTGSISTTARAFTDTFTVSSSTPTISLAAYLSSMSCSDFKLISATGFRVGATTSTSPNITVTGVTSNSVSLIANQTNTATVVILGLNVLSGLPTILVPDPTNIKIVLSFIAW